MPSDRGFFGQLSWAKRSASALGLDGVVELCERVVLLHEAQFLLHHLLGEPFVAIDVDLDSERQPGLQANVDQAELGIEEVVIEDPLLPGSADELGPVGTRHKREGRTRLLGAEDTDKSLGDTLVADEVLGPLVLAELAGAIQVDSASLPRPALSMRDETVRVLRRHGFHEVGAANFQNAIDEVFEFAGSRQGQMALEDDAVKTGEHGDDQAGKLGDEARQRLHGVLLQKGSSTNPILRVERRLCSTYLVVGVGVGLGVGVGVGVGVGARLEAGARVRAGIHLHLNLSPTLTLNLTLALPPLPGPNLPPHLALPWRLSRPFHGRPSLPSIQG